MIGYDKLMSMIGGLNVEHQAEIVIEINDPRNIFKFAKNLKNVSIEEQTKIIIIEKLAKAIIKSKNAEYIYKFARYIPGAPVKELAFAILATKDLDYIFKFAGYVKNAPIDKITKYVIKNCDAWHIYRYARRMGGNKVSLSKLADAVIKKGDAESIYWFAINVEGAPIDKLAKGIAKCDYSPYFSRFIHDIKTAPIDKMVNIVIQKGSFEHLRILLLYKEIRNKYFDKLVNALIKKETYWMLETVIEDHIYHIAEDGLDKKYVDKLVNAIIAINDGSRISDIARSISRSITNISNKIGKRYKDLEEIEHIQEATTYIKGDLINKLADAAIATNNAEYIYDVAKSWKFKGDVLDELADAIIATKNEKYIFYFFAYVEGAPIDKLIDMFKDTKNITDIWEKFDNEINSNRTKLNILLDLISALCSSEKDKYDRVISLAAINNLIIILINKIYCEGKIDEEEGIVILDDEYFKIEDIKALSEGGISFALGVINIISNTINNVNKFKRIKNKTIRRPKVNTTLEQPKRYVRTKK